MPAAIVARELELRLIDTICCSTYEKTKRGAKVEVLKGTQAEADKGEDWLIVDDLVDTGVTAERVRQMLPKAHFATVYAKPAGRAHRRHLRHRGQPGHLDPVPLGPGSGDVDADRRAQAEEALARLRRRADLAHGSARKQGKERSMAKVALVTGAGSGVGKAAALGLAKEGYDVGLVGRRAEMLEAVATEARAAGVKALVLPGDAGDPQQVKAIFAKLKEGLGRIDVLFNNAGTGRRRSRWRTSPTSSGKRWSISTSPARSSARSKPSA